MGWLVLNRSTSLNTDNSNKCVFSPLPHSPHQKRPTGLKYEKAKEWRIPCVNAQWLGDILLGNFEALRQTQYGRYTAFGLQDPFAPTPQLVLNLLGKWAAPGLQAGAPGAALGFRISLVFSSFPASSPHCLPLHPAQEFCWFVFWFAFFNGLSEVNGALESLLIFSLEPALV